LKQNASSPERAAGKTLSKAVGEIKGNASKWINEHELIEGTCSWQAGYGAFTVRESQIENVVKYIENQEIHHSERSFQEEFLAILDINGVTYDLDFIWE
jgi:hypothetical protein